MWLKSLLKTLIEQDDKGEDKKAEEIYTTKKTCDKVFAEYLWDMSKKVNEKFFYLLAIFVKAYKDCMNEYGWEILKKYKQVTPEERRKEFAINNDAEHVPEASNDFVRYFLPREYSNFDKNLSIELTRHLCEWVRKNKYTHTCITLI